MSMNNLVQGYCDNNDSLMTCIKTKYDLSHTGETAEIRAGIGLHKINCGYGRRF